MAYVPSHIPAGLGPLCTIVPMSFLLGKSPKYWDLLVTLPADFPEWAPKHSGHLKPDFEQEILFDFFSSKSSYNDSYVALSLYK